MRRLLVLIMLAALAGCGVIAHGRSQQVTFTTVPAGALVRLEDSGGQCTTPCSVTLSRKKDETLVIERDGYEKVTFSLKSVMLKSSVANMLLPGGLVCWGIDLVSGGAYRIVPERVELELKPLAPDPQ